LRTSIRRLAPYVGAALFLSASPAFAQNSDTIGQPSLPQPEIVTGGDSVSIAVGVATIPGYEGSDKNRIIPAGLIRGSVSGINFISRGAQLFVDVVPGGNGPTWDFQLGPVVGLNFDRTNRKNINDTRVEALGERKTAIEVGGYAGIGKTGLITSDYDKLTVSVSYVQDINKAHKSYIITPGVDYGTPLSRKMYVGLSGSASYVGGEYADTYFSIDTPGSIASTLPAYNAGKGWKNYQFSGYATYSLTGDLTHGLSVLGGVSYSRLLGDFARSPVVSIAGDRNQWLGAVGLAYTF
jgi:outer membrane scaffolding protein for murein synthesis (MipA/OmpV family)